MDTNPFIRTTIPQNIVYLRRFFGNATPCLSPFHASPRSPSEAFAKGGQFPSLRSFAAIPILCGVFASRSSFIRVIREIRGKVGLVAAMLLQVHSCEFVVHIRASRNYPLRGARLQRASDPRREHPRRARCAPFRPQVNFGVRWHDTAIPGRDVSRLAKRGRVRPFP